MEDNKVEEVVSPGKKLPESKDSDVPVPEPEEKSQITCGYQIGTTEKDTIVFDLIGNEQSLIKLYGLHQLAGNRLTELYNQIDPRSLNNKMNKIVQVLKKITETLVNQKGKEEKTD